jgi:6-phosphogluconolactonase
LIVSIANPGRTHVVRRFADLDALSQAAADDIIALARAAVAARGTCSIALAGGSTPQRLFRLLTQRRDAAPWPQIDVWWGDERPVPPDHPESNYRMAREVLLDPLHLGASQVHRIAGELEPDAAARAYEGELVAALGAPPVFDVVLLGMGSDGHTASLFPGSPAVDPTGGSASLADTTRWVVANPVTSPLVRGTAVRITLTAPALNAARHIRFLVAGADKAAALAQVLEGPRDPQRYPSQLISPAAGDIVWLVDTAAAAGLRGAA